MRSDVSRSRFSPESIVTVGQDRRLWSHFGPRIGKSGTALSRNLDADAS